MALLPGPLPLAIQVAEKAMQEFIKRWLAGLQPHLFLETNHDGQISVASKVSPAANARSLPYHAHVPHPRHHMPRPQPHRDTPARRRRREKRAKAREEQAAAAAQVEPAVPEPLPTTTAENVAVIVDNPPNETIPPEPVRHPAPQSQPTAAQVAPRPPLLAATAGQPRPTLLADTAGQPRPPPLSATTGRPPVGTAAGHPYPPPLTSSSGPRPLLAPPAPASGAPPQPRTVAATAHPLPHPPPHVPDMFCPDSQYLTGHIIPHLDGPSHPPGGWPCKCCFYETFLDTKEQLDHHHEAHLMRYEECNICFTGHVWKSR